MIKRPMQGYHEEKVAKSLIKNLDPRGKTIVQLTRKANGWSSVIIFEFDHSGVVMYVLYRKEGFQPMLEQFNVTEYLTSDGVEMIKSTKTCLLAEVVACLHGDIKQELGHTAVPTAMKEFVKNGKKNKGPIHLRFSVFGVGYTKKRTGSPKMTIPFFPAGLVRRLFKPNNPLLDVVETIPFTVQLIGNQLHFRERMPGDREGSIVASSMEDFMKYAKKRAGAYEGWVMSFGENYGKTHSYDANTTLDSFGKHRAVNAIKVKSEPHGTCIALRVLNENDPDEPKIWIFARGDKSNNRQLVYVADVSDNPIISEAFKKDPRLPILTYSNKEEYEKCFTADFNEVGGAGHIFKVIAAGLVLPKKRCTRPNVPYFTGVKIYGTVRVRVWDFNSLTVMSEYHHPHWDEVFRTQEEYKRILANKADEADFLRLEFGLPPPPTPMAAQAVTVLGKRPRAPVAMETVQEPGSVPEGKPLTLREQTPERETDKKILKHILYVDDSACMGPTTKKVLKRQVESQGHVFTNTLDSSVTIIVSNASAIARMEQPGFCTCAELREKYPEAAIVTPEQAKKILSPANA